jgi:UDPglucose 6-dehydrogenase
MTVVVVGAGYVGLVTAACLASLGHRVRCVDVDAGRIAGLRAGVVPIAEPGLDPLVRAAAREGRISFHTRLAEAVPSADMAIVAVGTVDGEGRWTDLNVQAALVELLAQSAVPPAIVIRSTLRPGRMQRFADVVASSGRTATLLLNPEFTRESTAVSDFLAPDRIVVGTAAGAPETQADPLRRLYAGISAPILVVDYASAELIKIGSNAFLATKITFANELARFCVAAGADMALVRKGIGMDGRIGPAFLAAGPGFGGSCLPSQVELLSAMAEQMSLGLELIPAVHRFNRRQPRRLAADLLAELPRADRVAVLGLSFKAGTDDIRESPSVHFIDALHERGVPEIRAFDPAVVVLPARPWVTMCVDPYEAAQGADALAITTEWADFRTLDWDRLARVMRGRDVLDARSVADAQRAQEAGFRVRSLERRTRPRVEARPSDRCAIAPAAAPASSPAVSAVSALVGSLEAVG